MNILIIAEHDNTRLTPTTLPVISAARLLGDDISLLVAGYQCRAVAEAAADIDGISRVYLADAEHYESGLAEELTALVAELVTDDTNYILAASSTFGKNLMPRIAATLDVAQISDIVSVNSPDTFVRPVYAGNVLATVQSRDKIKVMTVRATAFEPVATSGGKAELETITSSPEVGLSSLVKREFSASDRPDLTSARVVISGGRGLGTAESFNLLGEIADKLDAAIGASRAAVDAGFISNDHQVGQTGKVVAPELYIAVGISGAIQHLAGMKDSKVIVAINRDADAPIFDFADYGLVADLFQALPELSMALDSLK